MGSGSEVALVLMGLYVSMGNALALQYGGSATHNTVTNPPPLPRNRGRPSRPLFGR